MFGYVFANVIYSTERTDTIFSSIFFECFLFDSFMVRVKLQLCEIRKYKHKGERNIEREKVGKAIGWCMLEKGLTN